MSSPLALFLALSLAASPAFAAKAASKPKPTPKPAPVQLDLDPAIETHAERYATDLQALEKTRAAELANRRTTYLAELDATFTQIGPTGDAALIAMLRKEREGIARGLVTPANPVGLPPEVQAARKVFFNRVEAAGMAFIANKKKLDEAYLKLLTTLARQTKNDKPLAARIAAEKRRIQTGL